MKFLKPLLISSVLFSTPVFATPIIAQYFGIWTNTGQTWSQKFRSDTPFQKLNRIYVSFGKIITGKDGHLTLAYDGSSDNAAQLIQKVREENPSAEIFLTVGGDDSMTSFGGAASDPEFADNVLNFLIANGYTGFDIDWEEDIDENNLDILTQNLANLLHNHSLKLTLDVWPYPGGEYDMPTLAKNLDQINIMSYGKSMKLSDCVNSYVQSGFPIQKIIGGIESETAYDGNDTDSLGANGSIAKKSKYALNNGLAGMMEWRLDNDYATVENPNYPTYQAAIEFWNDMNS